MCTGLSCELCLCPSEFTVVDVGVHRRGSGISESRMNAHLKALGADFLAFLHPGDPGFGLPTGLAHK